MTKYIIISHEGEVVRMRDGQPFQYSEYRLAVLGVHHLGAILRVPLTIATVQ